MRWSALALLAGAGAWAQALPVDRPQLKGAIVGRVCASAEPAQSCPADAPGLAHVRLVLETGQEVWTDTQGRYHLTALEARAPELDVGIRLAPGRHRLRLDTRTLPAGDRVETPSVTVELPMAGMALQDWVVVPPLAPRAVESAKSIPAGNEGELGPQALRFRLTGAARPGEQVEADGQPAQVGPDGNFRVWVTLQAGANWVRFAASAPDGSVRLWVEPVDVVVRPDSALVVPRTAIRVGTLKLPAPPGGSAAAGAKGFQVVAPPGTELGYGGARQDVPKSGRLELPLTIAEGPNALVLSVRPPGGPTASYTFLIQGRTEPFAVGLLDLQLDLGPRGGVRLVGQGAAHADVHWAGWDFAGELKLDDRDVAAAHQQGASVLVYPTRPETPGRALDPQQYPFTWADQSTSLDPNSAGGHLRFQAKSEDWGKIGFGTHREQLVSTELGRYQRESFGAYADLHTPPGASGLGLKAFASPGLADPTRGLATLPGHDELHATGGSLFYLSHVAIAQGTEVVRVEIRQGVGGAPLAERHLVRGRDYEIDYTSGRILLAQPLSFIAGVPVLLSDPMLRAPEPVLVVDYERLELGIAVTRSAGGELTGVWGPLRAGIRGVEDNGPAANRYRLAAANVALDLSRFSFQAEGAVSQGSLYGADGFTRSDDGGLSFFTAPPPAANRGEAWLVRMKGPGPLPGGSIDASYRNVSSGFTDAEHQDGVGGHQLLVRATQPLGPVTVALLGNDVRAEDPREPFLGQSFHERQLGASASLNVGGLQLGLQAKDSDLTAALVPYSGGPEVEGGRTAVGGWARYRLSPTLALVAGHDQMVGKRGSGPGAVDDTFSTVGADYSPNPDETVGLRAGYGPKLGPLVWGQGNYRQGDQTYYGTYSVDTDGPDFGSQRAVTGVRTSLGQAGAVFVEDVLAHDADAVRMSRAVGISETLAEGLQISGRYEHGVRDPLDSVPSLSRNAAGVTASLVRPRYHLFGRAELRGDDGTAVVGPQIPVRRLQRVLGAAADAEPFDGLQASARVNFADTTNLGLLESRFLEAAAGLAYRAGPFISILHYSLTRELPPPPRAAPERSLQMISLQPAWHVTDRIQIASGLNAGYYTEGASSGWVLSASIRPSVDVWHGIEVAVEGARRTSSPDGAGLWALRGELGYRISPEALLAAGYNVVGYRGLGLSSWNDGQQDRLYFRAELGW